MTKKINVGLVGYGFAGKIHSHAYRELPICFETGAVPVMKAICGRTEAAVAKTAQAYGWESYETSWEKLIKRDDIDLVDITTHNAAHKDIAIAAARAGKHVICEKPLATSLADAQDMLEAVESADIKHMVCFNYRKVPAIGLAKKLVEEGQLGKIFHFRGVYLQDYLADPQVPLSWQLKKEFAGTGAHGDVNSHLIDIARYLVGEIDSVIGMRETFIKSRPKAKLDAAGSSQTGIEASGEMGNVTVDDTTLFLAKFANGAVGSFEASWLATGRKNGQRFEINGSKSSIVFELEDMNILWFYSADDAKGIQGFRRIQVTEPIHPYMTAWWPAGHIIGYKNTFVHLFYDFMKALDEDKQPSPNFVDGVECQRVLEAVEKSCEEGRWTKIREEIAAM